MVTALKQGLFNFHKYKNHVVVNAGIVGRSPWVHE